MCSKRVQQMCSVVTLLSYFDLGLHTLVAKVSCDQATLVICLDLPDFLIDFLAIPSFPESSGLEPADHLQLIPLGVSAIPRKGTSFKFATAGYNRRIIIEQVN